MRNRRVSRFDASIAKTRDYWPISDPASMEHLLDGLRKAGLPE
jgi:hypothetical protein